MKFIYTLTLLLALSPSILAQTEEAETQEAAIEWLTFEEAVKRNAEEQKFIFIDVYTDWCGWCIRMDQSTFKDEQIISYINEHFYAVKFDAEQKEDITYKGATFKFVDQGRRGYHELAANLLQGQMSYPSFVILTKEEEWKNMYKGYRSATDFLKLLQAEITP